MIEYLLISVFAFVWANILIAKDEIFGFYKPMLLRQFGITIQDPERRHFKYWQWFIWKITTCQSCMAGQIALWYSVYLLITIGGNAFYYILMIMLSIAGAHFLNVINNALKPEDGKCNT